MRITGGSDRGRRLKVPPGIRPTGGRVREALFAILGDRVVGATFLDLFAGSGAVGLEALSRGADGSVFVERRGKVVPILKENCRHVAPERRQLLVTELPGDIGRRLEGRLFDLVFADPPYDFEEWGRLLQELRPVLALDGRLALEHSARTKVPSEVGDLRIVSRRAYGESCLTIFAVVEEERA